MLKCCKIIFSLIAIKLFFTNTENSQSTPQLYNYSKFTAQIEEQAHSIEQNQVITQHLIGWC